MKKWQKLKLGEQKAEMGLQDGETTGLWDYGTTDNGTTGRNAETLKTANRPKRSAASAVAGLGCLGAWPGKLFSFTSSHLCCSSRHRRCHLLDCRHDVARAVGGTLCPVLALGCARPAAQAEPAPAPAAEPVAA
jgi:hypothetical protein